MRIIFFVCFISLSSTSFAQLGEGFDPHEVRACIAMCNSYTFQDLYGSDVDILPKEYKKTFTSEAIGMDNMFQVYEKGEVAVINFRGSTTKISSWVENMYSAMIPSQGIIKIDEIDIPYKFANDTTAAVHSGYALAVVLLSPILLEQIEKLNQKGIYQIIITGHSQGGALANMSRAYLENLPSSIISAHNIFKTYAFANPMCGNREFAEEYEARYCENNMSYSIINPADFVPKMPMHYQDEGKLIRFELIKNNLLGNDVITSPKTKSNFFLRITKPFLATYIQISNSIIERIVSRSYVAVEMPGYTREINFFQTGTIHTLQPFAYPNGDLSATKTDANETKNDEEKGSASFQHKPYNYYVAVLKEYFTRDYNNLKMQYLPENL